MDLRLTLRDRHSRVRFLKPILRAYALGYLSAVTPKLVAHARHFASRDWTPKQKFREVRRRRRASILLTAMSDVTAPRA
jgi:hypothetical protein